MRTKISGAKFSAILANTRKIREEEKKKNEKFLYLNRGVNSVVNIDLSKIITQIDFNTTEIQVYPPNQGRRGLLNAINENYFSGTINEKNLFIVSGSMNGLSLIFSVLDIEKVYTSRFYWGAYSNILKINNIKQDFYEDFSFLEKNLDSLKNQAVIICDPNNPLGNKDSDDNIFDIIKKLEENNTTIIWDSPYRKLYVDNQADNYYSKLSKFKNIIILDSFSKSIGLSGQRIAFIFSQDEVFNQELAIRVLYMNNGVNAFAQILVEKLLSTKEGKIAINDFKTKTVQEMEKNISYLIDNNLLAKEFYINTKPVGIFAIVNKSYEKLLKYNIGSVSLNYFTNLAPEIANKYARILVSVKHEEFKRYFDKLLLDK